MDMDKYFRELEKEKENGEKSKDTSVSGKPAHCPMCSRHCDLTAPMCGQGEMFAQQNL